MTYTIRDEKGNMLFSIENVNPDVSFESINNELDNINKESNMLAKSIESFNIISDAKAMEAFGYVKGAGFKENIKAVSKEIWKKIQEFFKKIIKFIKNLILDIKLRHSHLTKQQYKAKLFINKMSEFLKHKKPDPSDKMYEVGGELLIKFINSEAVDIMYKYDFSRIVEVMKKYININKEFNDLSKKYDYDNINMYIDQLQHSPTKQIQEKINKFKSELRDLNEKVLSDIKDFKTDRIFDKGHTDSYINTIREKINDENIIDVFKDLTAWEKYNVPEEINLLLSRTYEFLIKYENELDKKYTTMLNDALDTFDKAESNARDIYENAENFESNYNPMNQRIKANRENRRVYDGSLTPEELSIDIYGSFREKSYEYMNMCGYFWRITSNLIKILGELDKGYTETISIFGNRFIN